jgi:hypothetical protein
MLKWPIYSRFNGSTRKLEVDKERAFRSIRANITVELFCYPEKTEGIRKRHSRAFKKMFLYLINSYALETCGDGSTAPHVFTSSTT